MTSSTVFEHLRLRGRTDDHGAAMVYVLMLIMVLTSLAILVVGLTLSQTAPTLYQDKNVRTLAAAQAGLDAAAFQIRHANTGGTADTPMGDIYKLPCSVSGPVDGAAAGTRFSVEIAYYKENPESQDEEWLAENELECRAVAGSGGGLRDVARYALLRSEGIDPTATATAERADRVLEATYTFQLTTRKIAGGRIWDDRNSFCWVASSADVGATVRYRSGAVCADPTELNSWTWADDYMIHLSSTDAHGAIPLCLSGRASSSTPIAMTLRECTSSSTDPYGQRFAWTGDHTWRGQNSANTAPANSFIVNQSSSVANNHQVSVATGPGWKSVNPDPAVGKGNASYETNQVVNHQLFGRCLDVTDTHINATYMITYPCKQDPSGGDSFDWNHKWYYSEPETGQELSNTKITVITGGTTYCLITAGGTTRVTETGTGLSKDVRFPRFVTAGGARDCTSATTTWKRYGYHDDESLAYHIVDSNGRCLSASGPRTTSHPLWNTVVVETCSDSEAQKWNVPTDPVDALLSDFEETTGRSGG